MKKSTAAPLLLATYIGLANAVVQFGDSSMVQAVNGFVSYAVEQSAERKQELRTELEKSAIIQGKFGIFLILAAAATSPTGKSPARPIWIEASGLPTRGGIDSFANVAFQLPIGAGNNFEVAVELTNSFREYLTASLAEEGFHGCRIGKFGGHAYRARWIEEDPVGVFKTVEGPKGGYRVVEGPKGVFKTVEDCLYNYFVVAAELNIT